MPKRLKKIDNIESARQQGIFFDANVLIYIFWSVFGKNSVMAARYSSIYKFLIKEKIPMITSCVVLSEVINRVLRIEYNNIGRSKTFKEFRNSSEGKQIQEEIFAIIKNQIFSVFTIQDICFTVEQLRPLLKADDIDFNDKIIVETCKAYNMILLTHDADFFHTSIDIFSKNTNLCRQ